MKKLIVMAVVMGTGFACMCATAFAKTPLIFNEDDSHCFKSAKTSTPEALVKYLDGIVMGGQVTHFFMCVNAMRANYPSRTMEPAWAACDVPGWKQTAWSKNLKALYDMGVDPYKLWIGRCREKGVSPWISFRMNDMHEIHDMTYGGHSRFWREHRDFWCVPDTPEWNHRKRALDYAHPEVRAYMLGFIRETLERYDPDGIECDWMRFPQHLTFGRERELSGCLDDFMREVREIARAAAKRRGHPVKVGVRVDSRPEKALARGTDAFAWARRGYVDLVVPCNFFISADFGLPIDEWTARLAKENPSVRAVPGLDVSVTEKGKSRRFLKLDEYCGWADRMYARGAVGIYVFNLFDNQRDEVWKFIINEGLGREAVASQAKSIPADAIVE